MNVIKEFFNISIKFLAKDTLFLKYLATFVAQKLIRAFEGLKNQKKVRIVAQICKLIAIGWVKCTIFAPNEKH